MMNIEMIGVVSEVEGDVSNVEGVVRKTVGKFVSGKAVVTVVCQYVLGVACCE